MFTRNVASIWYDMTNVPVHLLGLWTNHLNLTSLSLPFMHAFTTDLLSWSEEDMRVHPQAAVLGAGKNLYPELQGTCMLS